MSKELVGAWIQPEVKRVVESLADIKGISLSEYVRSLILEDLDKRTVFTSALKKMEDAQCLTNPRQS